MFKVVFSAVTSFLVGWASIIGGIACWWKGMDDYCVALEFLGLVCLWFFYTLWSELKGD